MVICFVDIVFCTVCDEYGRRHVPPTLFSKYFYVLTLTFTTRAQVQNAWYTKHVTYVAGFCIKCGQPLWALLTVFFEGRFVLFLAHVTSQLGMETTCLVLAHSVICTKILWTIGSLILNESFDTVVIFFFFVLDQETVDNRKLHCE